MSFEMLAREHDRIEEVCSELYRMTVDCDIPLKAAASAMDRLSASVFLHTEHENMLVYSIMSRHDDSRLRREAEAFLAEYQGVRSDCRRYLLHWTEGAIAEDWQGFCRETPGMLKRMRARAAHEESVIYPLALARGFLPYRSARG